MLGAAIFAGFGLNHDVTQWHVEQYVYYAHVITVRQQAAGHSIDVKLMW